MFTQLIFKMKQTARLSLMAFVFTFWSISSLAALNKTLSFFDGALQVKVQGPVSLASGASAKNPFNLAVLDGEGNPYPPVSKKWIKATTEMTNMNMGITPVTKIEDVLDANRQLQGKVVLYPTFSMAGPWKMNITITVSGSDGKPMQDTQSVTFDVAR